jgi:hypothetical protein
MNLLKYYPGTSPTLDLIALFRPCANEEIADWQIVSHPVVSLPDETSAALNLAKYSSLKPETSPFSIQQVPYGDQAQDFQAFASVQAHRIPIYQGS